MAKLTDHIEKEQSLQDYSRYVVKLLKPKPVPEEPRYSPYAIPVNDELHQKLTQQLSSLAIPKDVITILRRQGIYTVFDLVSLSKSDYEDIYGLSVSGEAKLKSCITDMGLKLFMPVYWNKERKKYMMWYLHALLKDSFLLASRQKGAQGSCHPVLYPDASYLCTRL